MRCPRETSRSERLRCWIDDTEARLDQIETLVDVLVDKLEERDTAD